MKTKVNAECEAKLVALLKERDEALKLVEAWKQQAVENDEAVRRAALKDAADYIRGLCGPEMDSVADEIETFDEEGGDHE